MATYIIMDFYTEHFEKVDARNDEEVETYLQEFIQGSLNRCDISETAELDITVVGPIGNAKGKTAKVREIWVTEIPPTEPSYEIEWR